jgi:preprotein translocase subunit SecA
MAGRGTDIKLGPGVADIGGLHILGTERHEARRIDNQLRGRSGRQGDPGSSRFFLSLRDELLAVFAGEWTVKVLGWMGLREGQAIEDKRVSKGIERAQKKVEERNFEIRKNLLEYDEVMDHQRKYFYTRRQQILEGRQIDTTVRDMLAETIRDAVADYLAPDFIRRTIAEWARQATGIQVTADQVRGDTPDAAEDIERGIRDLARDEAVNTIGVTTGEYIDPEASAKEWDLRGLSAWAQTRFGVNISQNQLRKMTPEKIVEELTNQAIERIDRLELSGFRRYLEADFGRKSLLEWVRNRFGVEMTLEDLAGCEEIGAVEEKVIYAVEAAYQRREIEYPVEYAIDITLGQAPPDSTYAVQALCEWANRKYDADWSVDRLADKTVGDVRDELVDLSEEFFAGGRLERTVDEFLASAGGQEGVDVEAARRWAAERFDTKLRDEDLEGEPIREVLIRAGRAFLRRELTELERFLLLQVYDSSWKDHLLAMDHLKGGVGLRAHAEQDPKIVYKKEGSRLFDEMLSGIRDKVTDMVFKARLTAESEMQSVYQVSQAVHEQLSGYDHLAQDMAAQQQAGQPQKAETIVRAQPKVGRNDPCPCGSGKKYKKCCGKGV